MNMRHIILFFLASVVNINAESLFDQYENTRKEFVKCKNSWSSLVYGCDTQYNDFIEIKNELTRPLNDMIEESKNSDVELAATALECKKEILLNASAREKYLGAEKAHGSNSLRYYFANTIKKIIESDTKGAELGDFPTYAVSRYLDNDTSIETKITEEFKRLHNYIRDKDVSKHIKLLLRPENTAIIDQAITETEEIIHQLQIKDAV